MSTLPEMAKRIGDLANTRATEAQRYELNKYFGEWELLLGSAVWIALGHGLELPLEMLEFSDPYDVASDDVSEAIKAHFAERGITA